MPGISRITQDTAGGTIVGVLAPKVFVNGTPIAVKGAAVSGHGPGCMAVQSWRLILLPYLPIASLFAGKEIKPAAVMQRPVQAMYLRAKTILQLL
jgi:hypothetical protein